MRRRFFSVLVVLLMFPVTMLSAVTAQEATPESPFANAGLPELQVTMTATGYEGIPDEIESGRYLVTLNIEEGASEFGDGGISFVQAPVGISTEDFMAAFTTPPDESGVGEVAGTPIVGAEATPASVAGGLPAFLFSATYAGGIYSFSGEPSQVVLDFTPGEWIGWADNPEVPQEPVTFNAVGEMPADLLEPEAAATMVMGEYIIEVAEGELTTGSQVVRIDNIGSQPHFIGWFQMPDGTTEEDIETLLEEEAQAMTTGTPPAYSGLNPETDLMPVTFTATQSPNMSMWIVVDLQPGTHGLICFFPDVSDGREHAFHGMYNVIEVGE